MYSCDFSSGSGTALEHELNSKPSRLAHHSRLFFSFSSPSLFWESFCFFSPSACSYTVSGCVDAGQSTLVAACAHSEKEEKVEDEFSVKAARLGG